MRVCKVRRARSKRPFSMSSMEVSKRILSGCWVSLGIGLSYLWRRQAEAPRRSATTPNTVAWRREWRLVIGLLTPKHRHWALTLNGGSLGRDLAHFAHGSFGIGTVKNSRPCDDPITPGADNVGQVFSMGAAIDFDGEG